MTRGRRNRKYYQIRDLHFSDGAPACFHCSKKIPQDTWAEQTIMPDFSITITVTCPECGCMTPFERVTVPIDKHAERR